MNSPLNLYVSSKGVDHGPLTLEEAIQKVGSGQFEPDDLSWHQGVSGWVKLKELPEWSQINKSPLPSLTPEKQQPLEEYKQTKPSAKNAPYKTNKILPKVTSGNAVAPAFEDSSTPAVKMGMGILGKLMVALAILVFLCTFAVVGFLVYKNLDKFMPPQAVTPPAATEPVIEKPTLTDEPDPFAPPQ